MKFTLRDLLWLLLVVAVAASWFADRRRQSVEVQQIQETNKRLRREQEARHISSQESTAQMMSALRDEAMRLRGSPKE